MQNTIFGFKQSTVSMQFSSCGGGSGHTKKGKKKRERQRESFIMLDSKRATYIEKYSYFYRYFKWLTFSLKEQ